MEARQRGDVSGCLNCLHERTVPGCLQEFLMLAVEKPHLLLS
eukprot:CAMPEP_0170305828 /NCGR_PEP_ID=MMETSP0116_2-20130129/53291_1 /TAXON_ID=400756 /ORGANISM="Durinskia baltica, Strain CSIRO CS-38" /LENGTH=41 /DNA_ID= /DNA_START= /DNA_END= /DNA_ORIENTATION=